MLSRRFSLYVISSRTFKILKIFNLVKFNLSLGLIVYINTVFIFGVLYRRYTLFFFLRVSPQTLFLLVNFFIFLLKKIKFCYSSSYSLWISSTYTIICGINSSHFLISNKTSASNPLFMKNEVLLVILYLKVLCASILMGNSLTQLVC